MYHSREQVASFSDHQFAFIKVVANGHVLTITLNRPEKKNALHPVMINELAYAMAYAHYTTDVWVVVLDAAGEVFCAGADLNAFMNHDADISSTVPFADKDILIGEIIPALQKPCIAKVQGNAYAGAFLLLTGCTHVIATKTARFGLPEVKRGLFPFQVMECLLRIAPPRKVLDWCIRGYEIDTTTALEWQIITDACDADALDTTTDILVAEILENAPLAIRLGLEAYQYLQQSYAPGQQSYLMEMLIQTLKTTDAQEGIMAFREKRKPQWTGA